MRNTLELQSTQQKCDQIDTDNCIFCHGLSKNEYGLRSNIKISYLAAYSQYFPVKFQVRSYRRGEPLIFYGLMISAILFCLLY